MKLEIADSLNFSNQLEPGTIDLIISSPPYNLNKAYERKQSLNDYLNQMQPTLHRLVDLLKPGGNLCWQVGNYIEGGEVYPLDIYYYPLFKTLGLQLRNRIIWHFGHGLHASKRFSGRYETILWFSKGQPYTFNLDAARVPSLYPNKRYYKGPHKGELSGNPLGKNPADIWAVVASDWEHLVWDIPNVKHKHPEKTIHPCQFPIELAERLILVLSNAGDKVFDPYCGSGSTLLASLLHERDALGCDNNATYVQIANERIADWQAGKLKIRPLTRPVMRPILKET